MSHVVEISVECRDLDCLEEACGQLGLTLSRGQKRYRWYGQFVGDAPLPTGFTKAELGQCDHAVVIPGDDKAYQVGVVRRRDGKEGFTFLLDEWNGGYGLVDKIGQGGSKLLQEYSIAVAAKQARRQGMSVQRKLLQDGRVQLVCRR